MLSRALSYPRFVSVCYRGRELVEASSGVTKHSYSNPSAYCQAQSDGAAVWGKASCLFTRSCAIYDDEKIAAIKPYPNVAETLSALRDRGLKFAVVTDAHNGNALKRLRKAGLEDFFDAVITMDMHGKAKPSPEPFLLGMHLPGVTASGTMLVGDSIRRGIVPAKALGMFTVHAVYGDRNFHEGERRERADCVIRGIGEVIGVVSRNTRYRGCASLGMGFGSVHPITGSFISALTGRYPEFTRS